MKAHITVDLGFGDGGKGTIVDALVRRYKAGLVVRYNGGPQCGHNVYSPEGVHHTFSQFGATFVPDVYTLLGRYMLINPLTMQVEAQRLAEKGITDAMNRVFIDARARMITPYHRAVNRLRELARGADKHGSCGHGVGEAVADYMAAGKDALTMRDLCSMELFTVKLLEVRDRLRPRAVTLYDSIEHTLEAQKQFETFTLDLHVLLKRYQSFYDSVMERILTPYAVTKLFSHTPVAVFEGAQGVLLDQHYGFHPYTTWSTTTTRFAKLMLEEAEITQKPVAVGVTRTYSTRHGAGPFPTEHAEMTQFFSDTNNPRNEWQDHMRSGPLDLVLMRYALQANGPVDYLAVTHMDKVKGEWPVCYKYDCDGKDVVAADPCMMPSSIEEQETITRWLGTVKPTIGFVDGKEFPMALQSYVGAPVGIISTGPGPESKIFHTNVDAPV